MSIVDNLIAVASATARAIGPSLPAAIEIGKTVKALAESVMPTLSETDQKKLQEGLPPLLSKMNLHVDQAVKDLGGTGE